MSDDLARMLSLSKAALKDLASGDGAHWKEAVGELQSQYNEIVVWVLLYEDGDLQQTHAAFRETLRPHMEALAPLQIVLSYRVIVGNNVMGAKAFAAKLSGNDAVFSTGTSGKMDLDWFPLSKGVGTIFTSRDSKRTV